MSELSELFSYDTFNLSYQGPGPNLQYYPGAAAIAVLCIMYLMI